MNNKDTVSSQASNAPTDASLSTSCRTTELSDSNFGTFYIRYIFIVLLSTWHSIEIRENWLLHPSLVDVQGMMVEIRGSFGGSDNGMQSWGGGDYEGTRGIVLSVLNIRGNPQASTGQVKFLDVPTGSQDIFVVPVAYLWPIEPTQLGEGAVVLHGAHRGFLVKLREEVLRGWFVSTGTLKLNVEISLHSRETRSVGSASGASQCFPRPAREQAPLTSANWIDPSFLIEQYLGATTAAAVNFPKESLLGWQGTQNLIDGAPSSRPADGVQKFDGLGTTCNLSLWLVNCSAYHMRCLYGTHRPLFVRERPRLSSSLSASFSKPGCGQTGLPDAP